MKKMIASILLLLNLTLKAEKPSVVTTFSVIENLATQIGSDHIQVDNLVGAGIDPHTFEPNVKDIEKVKRADLIFANGVHFEPWLDKLIQISKTKAKVIYISRQSKLRKVKINFATIEDPHIWNSPYEVLNCIQVISEALIEKYPEHKLSFIKQSRALSNEVKFIDNEYKIKFEKIPLEKRVILTTHDSIGYLTNRYGILSLSTLGLSTSEDFKTKDLSELISNIQKYQIKTLFTEKNHHQILSQKLSSKLRLQLGKPLYLDGLSPQNEPANTIQNMLKYNLSTIFAAFE